MTMLFALPYPPSVNSYWRHAVIKGRAMVYICTKGKEYRKAVKEVVSITKPLTGDLMMHIYLTPPDARRRDIDNPIKALLDALTHAGLWEDDSQVRRMTVERLPKGEGRALVAVESFKA